ncbi:BACON domain-containing protein [Thermogemmatispora sp.]|uniref:BACON domain-containing protein n=1 Tax=Thermogemmatispora sp. TaxID=1968838 RepID=UPI001D4C7256|nr:hypothetical protein [Thermogemmatispora sp.]MBX5450855.1 hypothetical protein [Thermogemmatispora sp.]
MLQRHALTEQEMQFSPKSEARQEAFLPDADSWPPPSLRGFPTVPMSVADDDWEEGRAEPQTHSGLISRADRQREDDHDSCRETLASEQGEVSQSRRPWRWSWQARRQAWSEELLSGGLANEEGAAASQEHKDQHRHAGVPEPLRATSAAGLLASEGKGEVRENGLPFGDTSMGRPKADSQLLGNQGWSRWRRRPGRGFWVRSIFVGLTIVALVLIGLNGWLIRSRFSNVHQPGLSAGQPPFLTATPALVQAGQSVQLHLDHFPAFAQVYFSYDVGEALAPIGKAPIVQLGARGSADVSIAIGRDWSPGSHTIQAEDIATHYTASTTIQVVANGPLRPPVLQVSRSSLDLGTGVPGLNSVASLWLSNGGDGSLAWTASSDQPWLLTTPTQGVLSERQAILIAGSRANLRPGIYHGTITLSADSGTPLHVLVTMRVEAASASNSRQQALPLTLTPAALAFSLTDGGPAPAAQFVTLTNAAPTTMSWSSHIVVPPEGRQEMPLPLRADWLQLKPTQGKLAAGESLSLEITAQGEHLLPGLYLAVVQLHSSSPAVASATQVLAASLTVLPSCRLTLSAQSLTFTIGPGQDTAGNEQLLELGLAPGCPSGLSWQAFTSASWLKVDPSSGRIDAARGMSVRVGIAVSELNTGTYSGFILFSMQQRTQTVAVLLELGSSVASKGPTNGSTTAAVTDAPGRTPLGAVLSPSSLSFTVEQGGQSPIMRALLLSATQHALRWSVTLNTVSAPWLSVTPLSGMLAVGQTTRLSVAVDAAGLAPGSYSGQFTVSLEPTDGEPASPSQLAQVVVVTLTVLAPCVFEVTPSSLSFTSSLLQPNPPPQTLSLHIEGGCPRPVAWMVTIDSDSTSWLHVSQTSGSDSGSGTTIAVYVTPPRLLLKTLRGQITITASDGGQHPLQSSPQLVTVSVSPG